MILNYFPDRILVVGGTGFIGERVVRRLVRAGVNVRIVTRDPAKPVARALSDEGVDVWEGDCDRRWTIWEALEGCEALVSCVHIRHAPILVQACYRAEVSRIILLSSTRRYSKIKDPTVSQVLSAELHVQDSETEWTIIRPTMVYGSNRDRNISRIVEWTKRHRWIPVFGSGNALMQPVYVEDVVTAVQETLRRDKVEGRSFTVAGPEPKSWNDLLEDVFAVIDRRLRVMHMPTGLSLLGLKLLGPLARRKGINEAVIRRMDEDKDFDISDAREVLDFDPVPFEEGVRRLVTGESSVETLYPARPGSQLPKTLKT